MECLVVTSRWTSSFLRPLQAWCQLADPVGMEGLHGVVGTRTENLDSGCTLQQGPSPKASPPTHDLSLCPSERVENLAF